MPVRMFWSFTSNLNRIRAEEDLRTLKVAISSQSGEGTKDLSRQLDNELGKPIVAPEKPIDHAAGVAKLKALAGG